MDFLKDAAVPIFLLLLGIVGKWIVKRRWDREYAWMGPDLVLAAVGADLAHVIEYASVFFFNATATADDYRLDGKRLALTAGFLVVGMAAYVLLLKLHQWLEPDAKLGRGTTVILGVASNIIGLAAMSGLLFLLRRV